MIMELDSLRSIVTVLAFVAFVGIVAWAYSTRRLRDFERAAGLPFVDDEGDVATRRESAPRQ
jgi:cytochrome c oxidase cbb3-type subunit 4